ncbi:MAG: hypothetical protein WCD46_06400, partial [Desulfobacterales bacterium]
PADRAAPARRSTVTGITQGEQSGKFFRFGVPSPPPCGQRAQRPGRFPAGTPTVRQHAKETLEFDQLSLATDLIKATGKPGKKETENPSAE